MFIWKFWQLIGQQNYVGNLFFIDFSIIFLILKVEWNWMSKLFFAYGKHSQSMMMMLIEQIHFIKIINFAVFSSWKTIWMKSETLFTSQSFTIFSLCFAKENFSHGGFESHLRKLNVNKQWIKIFLHITYILNWALGEISKIVLIVSVDLFAFSKQLRRCMEKVQIHGKFSVSFTKTKSFFLSSFSY